MTTSVESSSGWAAPYVGGSPGFEATVSLPGSKSLTNRALILAALAEQPSTISHPLAARDTDLMVEGLRALGAGVGRHGDLLTVEPRELLGPADIECGLAGTVMRFLLPVAALAHGAVRLDGDPRARERPMRHIAQALRELGVHVDGDSLPISVRGTGSVAGGVVEIDASSSSQFVSALLLAGARFDAGVDVRHIGKPVPSLPHIDMSVTQLRLRGVDVDDAEPNRWLVRPGPISGRDDVVEPDLSNAGPFVAAAVVTGGYVRVRDWPGSTDQAGDRWRDLLSLMGAAVSFDGADLVVRGPDRPSALVADLHDVGELTPVVAAVCALADGPSQLTGIAHLRGHETDRLAAIARELTALGADVNEMDDGLRIVPGPLRGGRFETYADHRMAHAGAVLGLVVAGLQVVDIGCTAKTFPDFGSAWQRFVA